MIRAGQTTPETAINITIPTQLLEATETFGFRVINADRNADNELEPRAIYLKPEGIITLTRQGPETYLLSSAGRLRARLWWRANY